MIFYLSVLLFFALIPYEAVEQGWFHCPSTWVGLQCPGCGVTRAMTLLMHGHFAEAWTMNPVFCSVLFPGFLLTAGQDVFVTLTKKKTSFLEYILSHFA